MSCERSDSLPQPASSTAPPAAATALAVRIAGELDEGNVVFIVADDGWKYLSSGIYTRPIEEIENLESTVWW